METEFRALQKQAFDFTLPDHLIAQAPPDNRSGGRLLAMERRTGSLADHLITDLPDLLRAGDLLIFNNTRVLKARLFGTKSTGGQVELLIERIVDDRLAHAQIRANRAPRPGTIIQIGPARLTVGNRTGGFFEVTSDEFWDSLLERDGHIPLPPYIRRPDNDRDARRYQTVFGRDPGAVAAPTAGLHFDEELLQRLRAMGVEIGELTLHVGAGTFQPMRVDRIADHKMHSERFSIDATLAAQWQQARVDGRRIIAVGTTTLRALESAWNGDEVAAGSGETDIFIYPGVDVHTTDGLLTNFHLPQSTLLMLVSAYARTENILAAYQHAVDQQYRFFSYGDGMLIL